MEDKDLAYYLEDLNRIHDLSLEKLGEWRDKYPYSQVVHFLMAKKHQLEGFVDDMNVYHKASFYAVDRAYLQERMTHSELEMNIEGYGAPQSGDTISQEDGKDVNLSMDAREESVESSSKIESLTAQEPEVVQFETEDLSDFAQWVLSLSDLTTVEKKKKKKKKKKKSKLEKKIERSVIKKDEIVTEALANILAQQGHKEKAKDMYEKLSLIFPEKSSFFALQIEKLK
ncbi:hypothetical protein [Portibacter marinus]|uniref:hypothetical protein n=1 Tax=Portibacter marinus TaxID=2898660 RepID=UPI001F40A311|nr:hypothetical protein [Portibacter marinus]